MNMYVYRRTEPQLWTTGYYEPDGTWQPDEDFSSSEEAAERVHYLNGGTKESDLEQSVRIWGTGN